MLEKLEQRINELTKALETSASNHNMLIGAINEVKYIYSLLKQGSIDVKPIVDAVATVAPQLEPIAEVVDTIANS